MKAIKYTILLIMLAAFVVVVHQKCETCQKRFAALKEKFQVKTDEEG